MKVHAPSCVCPRPLGRTTGAGKRIDVTPDIECFGPDVMSIAHLRRLLHRKWTLNQLCRSNEGEGPGATPAELETEVISSLSDVLVATLVVANCTEQATSGVAHEHIAQSASHRTDSQTAQTVMEALRSNNNFCMRRPPAAPHALHIRNQRIEMTHLDMSSRTRQLMVRVVGIPRVAPSRPVCIHSNNVHRKPPPPSCCLLQLMSQLLDAAS